MEFIRTFLIYGLGAAASRLAAVFLVPLYTRTLSLEAYGQLEVLLALQLAGTLLAGLQSESALLRDYYGAKERGELPALIWGALLISLSGTFALALGVAAAWQFGLLAPYLASNAILLLVLTILAQLLGLQLIILRFAGTPVSFSVISFLDLGFSALFSVMFIVALNLGITGAILGMVCGKGICVLLAWRRTFGLPDNPWSKVPIIQAMLAYSLPTMPSVMLGWLQTNGTRVLLAIFLTLSDVGIVGVSMRVAALYGFVIYAFRLAWEPYAFKHIDNVDGDPHLYNRVLQTYILTMFPIAGGAILAVPMLVSIFAPPEYSAAVAITGFFIMGQFWIGAISITSIGIHGARVTSRLTIVYAAGAALNVATLALLASTLGMLAAAIGFLASQIVGALVAALYSERHFKTNFHLRSMAFALVGSIIAGGGAYLIYRPFADASIDWWGAYFPYVEIAALVAAMVGMIALWGIDREVRQRAIDELMTIRSKFRVLLK